MRRLPPESDPEHLRSARWIAFFRIVLSRQLRRSFHAVRVAHPGVPAIDERLPLIVYCNHPSWWDGALLPVLLDIVFPTRRAFGPIDAEALRRYGFMKRLGFFGVQPGTYAGAATFLRVGRRLLERSDTVFCVTPEGRFVDARVRPVRMEPGLAGLVSTVPAVTVLPIALEYAFWTERQPEALIGFGVPRTMGAASSSARIRADLADGLADAMDRLADHAISRDPARFAVLLDGTAGVGGVYDFGRRLKAWSQGRRFDAAHAPEP